MVKRGDKQKRKLSLMHFILAVAILSIIQPILIMVKLLPTLNEYFSFGSSLFNLLRLAILIYAGITFSKLCLKKSALNGAIIGFASSAIIVIFSYLSKQCCNIPILGIKVTPAGYWQVILFIIIENVVLGAFIAFISSWIAIRISKKKS